MGVRSRLYFLVRILGDKRGAQEPHRPPYRPQSRRQGHQKDLCRPLRGGVD